jgi:hypothetical protein
VALKTNFGRGDDESIKRSGSEAGVGSRRWSSGKLSTDNRKETEGVGEVRTKWDHERIVTATTFGERVKVLETYQLAADRGQLLVNVKMEMSMMGQTRAVEVRRVYDPPPN